MFCSSCGHNNDDRAVVCGSCKVSLAASARAGSAGGARLTSLERPGIITLLAVLNIVGAVFILAGAAVLVLAVGRAEDVPAAVPVVVGALSFLMAALGLACGLGLWGLRSWGRVMQIVFSCFGVLGFPVGTLIHGLILYYLFKPGVKVLFSGKAAPSLTPAEVQAVQQLSQSSAAVVVVVVVVGLFVMTSIIGMVAAIAIPNLLNAIQRGKQKRTMSDLRSIGTAIESYNVDNTYYPIVPSSPDVLGLVEHLEPTYIKVLPRVDAWKHPIEWSNNASAYEFASSYSIVSRGKDGLPDSFVPTGATTSFGVDIYFTDGQFSQFPEGTQD